MKKQRRPSDAELNADPEYQAARAEGNGKFHKAEGFAMWTVVHIVGVAYVALSGVARLLSRRQREEPATQ